MAVSKVIFDGTSLMDLTEDTVSEDTLLSGYTAHDASGALITGKMEAGVEVQIKTGTATSGTYPVKGNVSISPGFQADVLILSGLSSTTFTLGSEVVVDGTCVFDFTSTSSVYAIVYVSEDTHYLIYANRTTSGIAIVVQDYEEVLSSSSASGISGVSFTYKAIKYT